MQEYYLEYEILNDRPGLLGDVASFIGMLRINIQTVSSIYKGKRGFLLNIETEQQAEALRTALMGVNDLDIKIFHTPPTEMDVLTLKHGKRIRKISNYPPVYRFGREDLDYLIDFLGGRLNSKPDLLVGLRGTPRVGKTETAIASCVHANKPWTLISSTLLKNVIRTSVNEEFINMGGVFIIDAITTFQRSFPEHIRFVKNILAMNVPRIVEHPDILFSETDYQESDFDLIIELHCPEDEENGSQICSKSHGFYTFDIS